MRTHLLTPSLFLTLCLSSGCPPVDGDTDPDLNTTTPDGLTSDTTDGLTAGPGMSETSATPDATTSTTGDPSTSETGSATDGEPTPVIPCDLFPVYLDTSPNKERPWVRMLYSDCTPEEIIAGAAQWTLKNEDTDPPHPPGLPVGLMDDDPDTYPDTFTVDCVVVMWGTQHKAPGQFSVMRLDTPVIDSGFIMQYAPDHPVALLDGVWTGGPAVPENVTGCTPVVPDQTPDPEPPPPEN